MIKDLYLLFNKLLDIVYIDLSKQYVKMNGEMNKFEREETDERKFLIKMLRVLMEVETSKVKVYQ